MVRTLVLFLSVFLLGLQAEKWLVAEYTVVLAPARTEVHIRPTFELTPRGQKALDKEMAKVAPNEAAIFHSNKKEAWIVILHSDGPSADLPVVLAAIERALRLKLVPAPTTKGNGRNNHNTARDWGPRAVLF